MNLSPILHPASQTWMVGKIEKHTAKPLTHDEVEAHIAEFNRLQKLVGELQNNLLNEKMSVRALEGCLERSRAECETLARQAGELRRRVLRVDSARDSGERLCFTLDVAQFFYLPSSDRERYARVAVVEAMRNLMHSAIPEGELLAMLREKP